MTATETAPLTRRELREREREAEKRRSHRPTPTTPAVAAAHAQIPMAAEPPTVVEHKVSSASSTSSASSASASISSSSVSATPSWAASASAASATSTKPKARRSAASARVRKVSAAKTTPTASIRSTAASRLMSVGALLFAGALLVGMSVPASAFVIDNQTAPMSADAPAESGSQVVAADASVSAEAIQYDSWGVASRAELQQTSGIRIDSSYTVSNDGAVRWPFPVAVPISDGYGARVSPCSGCSSQHKGTDFTPGAGTAIAAIADGVVSQKNSSSWGFGYHVYIDHVINGQKVTSVYAHMQSGSSDLEVGDTVAVGDFVGLVGSTGASTGAHLHLEIRVDGVQVDPFAWLAANAG